MAVQPSRIAFDGGSPGVEKLTVTRGATVTFTDTGPTPTSRTWSFVADAGDDDPASILRGAPPGYPSSLSAAPTVTNPSLATGSCVAADPGSYTVKLTRVEPGGQTTRDYATFAVAETSGEIIPSAALNARTLRSTAEKLRRGWAWFVERFLRWVAGQLDATAIALAALAVRVGLLEQMAVMLVPMPGIDNAPRVNAAAQAVGYGGMVILLSGLWQWDTPGWLEQGVTYVCQGKGVEIVSSIAPTPGGGHMQAVFSYDGFTAAFSTPGAVSFIQVAAHSGDRTIVVSATTPPYLPNLAVGDEILVGEGTVGAQNQASSHIVQAVSIDGHTITLDRPLVRDVSINSPVTKGSVGRDIHIIGNGARVRGTGDRAISIVSAYRVHVRGFDIDGAGFGDYTVSFDTGSYASSYSQITVRGGGPSPYGFALEACEDCWRSECHAIDCGFLFQAAYNSGMHDCHAGGDGSMGICGISVGFDTDIVASHGVTIYGCSVNGCGTGIGVTGSSKDVDIIGCKVLNNTLNGLHVEKQSSSLVPGRVRVIGGLFGGNDGDAIHVDGATGIVAIGVHTAGNAKAVLVKNGGELTAHNCLFEESNTTGLKLVTLSQDAGSILRLVDSTIRSTQADMFLPVAHQGGRLEVRGVEFDVVAAAAGLIYLTGGSGYVERISNVGSSVANGVVADGPGVSVRRGPNAAFGNVTSPWVAVNGGQLSFGTVTLNGSTPVTLPFTDAKASDLVTHRRKTLAGTPGHYTVEPSAGVGIIVTGQAGDTSQVEVALQ